MRFRDSTAFRAIAIAEAVSWAALLVGMLVKHVVIGDERLVQVFGPIHGALFLGYLMVAARVAPRLGWGRRISLLAFISAVPPLATLAFERWATRRGLLAGGAPRSSEA